MSPKIIVRFFLETTSKHERRQMQDEGMRVVYSYFEIRDVLYINRPNKCNELIIWAHKNIDKLRKLYSIYFKKEFSDEDYDKDIEIEKKRIFENYRSFGKKEIAKEAFKPSRVKHVINTYGIESIN